MRGMAFLTMVENGEEPRITAFPKMAERQRSFLDRLLRRRGSAEDVARVGKILNQATQPDLDWDGKALASMSKIGNATKRGVTSADGGATPEVSYPLLRQISLKSEVVNAIIRRCVDDTLSNGYTFQLAEGLESGDDAQLKKVRDFFRTPNPDDVGNEWLESLVYDLVLFGDAYLELDGTNDTSSNNGEDWVFGGDLQSVWTVPADSMKLLPFNQTPEPPTMAYVQNMDSNYRRFAANKILHLTKFQQGRGYGTSPLIPLLEVITGQLNLSNYLNALYTGTLPKTILNVGDISNAEMKSMLGLIEQQLAGGKSPFGLIAINGGTGFNMHRLIDSTREGAQLDLLYYYREEICAVFGIPPMKLGWVQTGKLANPEQQLDSWYDVVESYHSRIAAMMNNRLLPLLDITDWEFEFVSIRPARDTERAETLKAQASAIATLRQEGAISINEAREILGFESILSEDANDPFWVSPKLMINQPADPNTNPTTDPEAPATLESIFPTPDFIMGFPDVEGPAAGNAPIMDQEVIEMSADQRQMFKFKRNDNLPEFDGLESGTTKTLNESLNEVQHDFVTKLMAKYNSRFADDDVIEMMGNHQISRAKAIGLDDVEWAVSELDDELVDLLNRQTAGLGITLTSTFEEVLEAMAAGTGVSIAFSMADAAALSYWQRRWILPSLRRTIGGYRSDVIGVFEEMVTDARSWKWASSEMRSLIDPSGAKYPAYFYERVARTEVRRVVENAHISALVKAGFTEGQRLVVVDTVTDTDLCLPFEDAVYPLQKSFGVLPAHPNCRCTMDYYDKSEHENPRAPLDDLLILKPDYEGGEIL